MRRLLHLAVWLYPRRWRHRYAAELHALIDDAAPRWADVFDIVYGGMLMRVRTSSPLAMAAAVGSAGALLTVMGTLAAPPSFESRGTLTATATGEDASEVHTRLLAVLDRAAVAAFGPNEIPRAHIAVTRTGAPNEIQVAYVDADPRRAQAMTERLMTGAIDANLEVARQDTSTGGMRLQITTPPDLPQAPARPFLVWLAAAGFGAGAVIGAVVGVVRRRAVPR